MLEIVVLIVLGKKTSAIVRAKGYRSAGYVAMLVGFWFLGEFTGGMVVGVLTMLGSEQQKPNLPWVYLGCLAGAATGAWFALHLAKRLRPRGELAFTDDDEVYARETSGQSQA